MNTEKDDLYGETPITHEHVKNNKNVRQAIVYSGIYPEEQPAEHDIKKVKRETKKGGK